MPLFAAGLGAMLLMAGLVIDGGNLFQSRQSLQNAADASATAAALEVASGNCTPTNTAACATYAGNYALRNGANGATGNSSDPTECTASGADPCALPACNTTPELTVTDTQPPTQEPGCYLYPYVDRLGNEHDDQVEVWLTRTTSNFFGTLLGNTSSHTSARAVAAVAPGGGSSSGFYIYSAGDLSVTGGEHIQEPVIVGGNLSLNASSIDSIARLVAVGIDGSGTISTSGNFHLGNGPASTLAAALPAATTSAMSLQSAAGFVAPGTVFLTSNPFSCTPAAPCSGDEWIAYGRVGGSQLQTLTRKYGGYNALGPSPHNVGDAVDGRVADLWIPSGSCGAFCATVNNVHAAQFPFPRPAFDVNTAFADAALRPNQGCSPSGGSVAAGFFGTGNAPAAPTGTTNLTPNGGYICKRFDGSGNVIGEIAWGGTAAGGFTLGSETVPQGVLKVIGTVFINASLTVANLAVYETGPGGAVIWTSGNFNESGGKGLCATSSCASGTFDASAWNPNQNMLGIVAHTFPGSTGDHCINISASPFQGALYADGGPGCAARAINVSGNSPYQAIMNGSSIQMSGGTANTAPTIADLPSDFPGTGGTSVTLVG